MNQKDQHNINLEEQQKQFFSKGKVAWNKSEKDVWAEIEQKLNKPKTTQTISLYPKMLRYAAAAIFILMVGLTSVVFFYSKTITCELGQRMVTELPDGSTVELNSGSVLEYYPLKWRFQRKLSFEGEGLFNVEKGKKFVVESGNGSTQVLGTSFNIYSRDKQYRVTCLTGKVKVSSVNNESVLLTPNMHVELEKSKLVIKKLDTAEKAVGWINNEFFFAGRPLKEVFDEIERQYAVTIKLDPQLNNRNFGSNFSKQHSVEDVLVFVCKTMKLRFEKQSENVFLVLDES